MSALWDAFMARAGGDYITACTLMTVDLMRGDALTFKAGYTLDNALLCVQDHLRHNGLAAMSEAQLARVAARVAIDAQLRHSIAEIVNYSYPEQEADYVSAGEPADHVFAHIDRVSRWLTRLPS